MEKNSKKSKLSRDPLKNQKFKKNSEKYQEDTISIRDESNEITTENLINRETQNPCASYNINAVNYGNTYCYNFPGLTEDLYSQNDIAGQLHNFTNIQNFNPSNLNMSIGSNFLGGMGYPYGPTVRMRLNIDKSF